MPPNAGLVCSNAPIDQLLSKADLFFTAVPHKTAMDLVPQLLTAGKKVIDLSADYRIKDVATYEEWYQPHSSPEFLEKAVYGLPELYREKLRTSSLVANPGCYPTSIILGLAPLLRNSSTDTQTITSDSKSGTSGAGRVAATATHFCEVHDGFRPYKVGRQHRHTPEIEQELTSLSPDQSDITITFTPHLLPISRGILSTIYATLTTDLSPERIQKMYEGFYKKERFVRVLKAGSFPSTQYVRGSNYCDIAIATDPEKKRVIIMSAIDNVMKGASGQ